MDCIQRMIDDETTGRFPAGTAPRLVLLHYGDHPAIEPGELYLQVVIGQDDAPWETWTQEQRDLLVRVFIEEAEEEPPLLAWERDHEAVSLELHREITAKVPGARFLEFWFGGDTGCQGQTRQRLRCPPDNPAKPAHELTVVDIKLGLADRKMLDTLITAGIAASRAEAISWALARIRERPAYAKLSERARELDDLKARF